MERRPKASDRVAIPRTPLPEVAPHLGLATEDQNEKKRKP
jgi:hypothetical protein